MKQILGEQLQFIAIDFPYSSTTAWLTAQLKQAVNDLDAEHDIVFLTDLLGGTPFRVASTLAMQHPGSEVITGTNLQLLLEMVLERDGLSSEAFRRSEERRVGKECRCGILSVNYEERE